MLLRVIIGLGFVLLIGGFGAAGWQYLQSMPAAEAAPAVAENQGRDAGAETPQTWLISPSGGLTRRDDAEAYLDQARFVESRVVRITQTARLTALLAEGEKLPEEPYLQVLSDIRAPMLAAGLCAALQDKLAAACAVQSARVVEGSVDPVAGTAEFRIDLVYRLKPEPEVLPDLATHMLMTGPVDVVVEPGSEAAASSENLLRAASDAVIAACDGAKAAAGCRVMAVNITWPGDGSGAARAEIGWLAALPKGMYPAPPLP